MSSSVPPVSYACRYAGKKQGEGRAFLWAKNIDALEYAQGGTPARRGDVDADHYARAEAVAVALRQAERARRGERHWCPYILKQELPSVCHISVVL